MDKYIQYMQDIYKKANDPAGSQPGSGGGLARPATRPGRGPALPLAILYTSGTYLYTCLNIVYTFVCSVYILLKHL